MRPGRLRGGGISVLAGANGGAGRDRMEDQSPLPGGRGRLRRLAAGAGAAAGRRVGVRQQSAGLGPAARHLGQGRPDAAGLDEARRDRPPLPGLPRRWRADRPGRFAQPQPDPDAEADRPRLVRGARRRLPRDCSAPPPSMRRRCAAWSRSSRGRPPSPLSKVDDLHPQRRRGFPQRRREPFIDEAALRRLFPADALGHGN